MPDIFIQHFDLPKQNVQHFTEVSKESFHKQERCYDISRGGQLSRIAIDLALENTGSTVVPIPFICDTGASCMYLGTGAMKILEDMGRITTVEDFVHGFNYRLKGKLCTANYCAENLLVAKLPEEKESVAIKEDFKANILGLQGMRKLGLI